MNDINDNDKDNNITAAKANESAEAMDLNKLADLKAKLEAQRNKANKKKMPELVRSIKFGVIGSGQAGSRLAETFYKIGYDAAVFNTAATDLQHIDIPDSNKLLLNYSIGGAAKSLEIGQDAAELNREAIQSVINNQLADAQMFVFCTSLGGGSGAGSTTVMIDILSEIQKPILVIGVLPMNSDDVLAKNNSLKVLNNLLQLVQNKTICNLIVVDNAKIESIYNNVGQMDFFRVANKAIVDPLDIFNTFSAKPSDVKGLDSMEFVKLLTDGGGLSVYGEFKIDNYEEDTAIAEAIIKNLNNNLLAGGFDIKQSRYVGVMICAPKKVWDKIPSSNINYAMAIINEECQSPLGTFKGIYESDTEENCVRVYSFFSGLGIPEIRITQLKEETKQYMETVKNKDIQRNLNLNINNDTDMAVSDAQKIKDKIANKSSILGKFVSRNVIDRRK